MTLERRLHRRGRRGAVAWIGAVSQVVVIGCGQHDTRLVRLHHPVRQFRGWVRHRLGEELRGAAQQGVEGQRVRPLRRDHRREGTRQLADLGVLGLEGGIACGLDIVGGGCGVEADRLSRWTGDVAVRAAWFRLPGSPSDVATQ